MTISARARVGLLGRGRTDRSNTGLQTILHTWRGGVTIGRRTYDQEVAGSIPGHGAATYDDSGQVVHTPNCLDDDTPR